MSHLLHNKKWNTGKGLEILFQNIENIVFQHASRQKKIFIGTDSFKASKNTCFVTAVCILHGDHGGSRYYFYKEKIPTKKYQNLTSRITEEARRSVEVAEYFIENYEIKPRLIELHLDVSSASTKAKTSKISDMLQGYVQGYGLSCKIKPNAWASQSVADRHSK